MNVLLFGATGMVGQGVLRECLLDPDVQHVQTIGRTAAGIDHPKLNELLHQNLWNFAEIENLLTGFDACFFCLGVSSAGKSESDYEHVTYGIAMAAADALARVNRNLTFVYVSGAGTDSTEKGRVMWACFGPGSLNRWTARSPKPVPTASFISLPNRCCRCCAGRSPTTF